MMTEINNKIEVGQFGISKSGQKCIITNLDQKRARIKFMDEFGAEIDRQRNQVKKGQVKNPYQPTVFGVGKMGNATDYTQKELKYWSYLMKRHSQGKLPNLKPRWTVFEYWLGDVRQLKDYELFHQPHGSIRCLLDQFTLQSFLYVDTENSAEKGKSVVVIDLFTNEATFYKSVKKAAEHTGWSVDSIITFCQDKAEKDGYKYCCGCDFNVVTGRPNK